MIIKNFEIQKYIGKKKIFLIYGLNEGLKDEIVTNFTNNYQKESIYKYSPIISNSIVWNLINSALFIKFTPKNTGDLFIDIRKK